MTSAHDVDRGRSSGYATRSVVGFVGFQLSPSRRWSGWVFSDHHTHWVEPSVEPVVEWHGHVLTLATETVDEESWDEVTVDDTHHECSQSICSIRINTIERRYSCSVPFHWSSRLHCSKVNWRRHTGEFSVKEECCTCCRCKTERPVQDVARYCSIQCNRRSSF